MKKLTEVTRQGFGNKAFNLAKLYLAGLNVKNALVIETLEVEKIIKKQLVSAEIISKIKKDLICGSSGLAVRSTGLGEDGSLSWPGQFKTRLFVRENELEDAVIECANAQTSEQVKAYARSLNVSVPRLALIVQEMVDAEKAGVIFTTNPVTGFDEIVIEAIAGVGETHVNGSCQPVRYYLDSETGIPTRTENKEKLELTAKEISQLFCLAKDIYSLQGRHQDIEWAFERNSGKLFVNQSRDITVVDKQDISLARDAVIRNAESALMCEQERLSRLEVTLHNENVLSDQNIAELITQHPCQMAFSLFLYEFAHGNGAIRAARNEIGYDIGAELETGLFQLIGGQPRCSIVHDAFTYRIKGIPLEDYCKIIDYYLEKIGLDPSLANYPEVVLYNQRPSFDFLNMLFGKKKAKEYEQRYAEFFANIKDIEDSLIKVCRKEFFPRWNAKMTDLQSKISTASDLVTLKNYFREVCELLMTDACRIFVKTARLGFFAYARLRNILTDLFGSEADKHVNVLTSGISPEFNPNLRFNIQLSKLKKGETSIGAVIEEFGHLALHELEISIPRYRDQPDSLERLANRITRDPLQDFGESAVRSKNLREKILIKAGIKKEEVDREIEMARIYLSLRETVKFEFLRAYDLLRQLATQMEKVLEWDEGSIFHLDVQEIFAIDTRQQELRELSEQRRVLWRANKLLYVPPIMSKNDFELIGSPPKNDSNVLHGIGATGFITEGKVVVVHNLEDEEPITNLSVGSILVTVTTDPAWTPLLSIIGHEGGLVTEIGGLLAHGAIYAREVGMAAVLNVPNATQVLKTGMKVRVNGQTGSVEILE